MCVCLPPQCSLRIRWTGIVCNCGSVAFNKGKVAFNNLYTLLPCDSLPTTTPFAEAPPTQLTPLLLFTPPSSPPAPFPLCRAPEFAEGGGVLCERMEDKADLVAAGSAVLLLQERGAAEALLWCGCGAAAGAQCC